MEALFEECELCMATCLMIWWYVDVLVFRGFCSCRVFRESFLVARALFLVFFIPARSMYCNDGVIIPEFPVEVEI